MKEIPLWDIETDIITMPTDIAYLTILRGRLLFLNIIKATTDVPPSNK